MLSQLYPFLFFTGLNSSLCILFRKRFGEMLPLSLLLSTVVMYVSQAVAHTFRAGFDGMLVFATASIALLICRRDRIGQKAALIFSNGFSSFCSVYLVCLIMDFHRRLSLWDEIDHWGKMTKEMLRLDTFYCMPESTLLFHKDYPPFMSLFQTLWCSLIGRYSEMGVSVATHVFMLSLIVPPLVDEGMKGNVIAGKSSTGRARFFLRGVIVGLCMTALYLAGLHYLDGYGTLGTIYVDLTLGILFACGMRLVWYGRVFSSFPDFITFCLTGVALISTKEIGVAFILTLLLYYYLKILTCRKEILWQSFQPVRRIFLLVLPPILPAAFYLYWKRLVHSLGIEGQFNVPILASLREMGRILRARDLSDNRFVIANNFIHILFTQNFTGGILPITYVSAFFIAIAVLALIYHFNKDRTAIKETRIIGATFAVGTAGYAAVMMFLYMFCFEAGETANFDNMRRYGGSYIAGEALFLSYMIYHLCLPKIRAKLTMKWLVVITILVVSIVNPSNLSDMEIPLAETTIYDTSKGYAEKMNQAVPPGSRVLPVLDQNRDPFGFCACLSYYSDDLINMNYIIADNQDIAEDSSARDKMLDAMKDSEYIYVIDADDSFNNSMRGFNHDQDFMPGCIYRVDQEENGQLSFSLLQ